jgi:hypothetical protein
MRPLGQRQIQNPPARMTYNPPPIRMPLRQLQIANVNDTHSKIIHTQPKKARPKIRNEKLKIFSPWRDDLRVVQHHTNQPRKTKRLPNSTGATAPIEINW